MIDEPKIIKAVQSLGMKGNDEGLIPVFGVYLANLHSSYYNDLSFGLINEVIRIVGEEMREDTKALLVHAALACAINTLGGILRSTEWEAIVTPMVENDTDKILGLVAVTNALGWGNWALIELNPRKKAIFHAFTPYEANLFKEKYGISKYDTCYMLQGVAAGMMELIFPREGRDRYYAYKAEEPKCIAKGDPHCVIIATPRDD